MSERDARAAAHLRRIVVGAVAGLLGIGFAVPALTGAGSSGAEEGPTVRVGHVAVPDLQDMLVGEAAEVTRDLGLLLDAGDVAIESEGHVVLEQAPAADSVVGAGATVTVETGVVGGAPEAPLTVRNRAGATIWVEDDDGRILVEPGKVVGYGSDRACGGGPLRAIFLDGSTIAVHVPTCEGETWVVGPEGDGFVLSPRASGSGQAGGAAVWDIERGASVDASSTSVPVEVQRLDCNSGVTGAVAEPTVEHGSSEVVITFLVERGGGGPADCRGNDRVGYDVVLDVPIGDRALVDGQCLPGGAAVTTSHCSAGGVRRAP